MKKFIIIVSVVIGLILLFDVLYYGLGLYITFDTDAPVETFTKTEGDKLFVDKGQGFEEFEIKGVNMGSGEPGEWSTDFHIDYDTYMEWFKEIREMGANTLRIYTVQDDTFYNAFYDFNKENPSPLYLIHGVWVNDYVQNSHRDAYDRDFYETFAEDCKTVVDVIHGNKRISPGRMASAGSGFYNKDISSWVIGYIFGVEWEDVTVIYTDKLYEGKEGYSSYKGDYLYTSPDASPFETMLAKVGDRVLEYESKRYRHQRLFAFSNWPTTDPFTYPENVSDYFKKCAQVDVEHIKSTEKVLAGQFVSYHVYPYYPDYLYYVSDLGDYGLNDLMPFVNEKGQLNTYRAYLSLLKKHHTMPLVITEFGVSTGRGMAQVDKNTHRNQGNMSEKEQGKALVDCWNDIKATGCNGGCVFTWQDEWFKRTWNTMNFVNLKRNPYWSDYQTNEQYFGLLSFDPGKEKSVCYVDGDLSEWTEDDLISDNGSTKLSMKYDERFIYFLAYKKNFDFKRETLYIPIDLTPKSGSTFCQKNGLKFDRAVDFIVEINGINDSRLTVQERYDALRSTYSEFIYGFNTYFKENVPERSSSKFVNVNMILQTSLLVDGEKNTDAKAFETGKLKYGNANPESEAFDSLADFCVKGDYVELKLPWQLLNFSDPSRMEIHDDYYSGNYGIEYINVDCLYAAVSALTEARIALGKGELEGWGNKVTYHQRLKSSYYVMKDLWGENS